MSAAEFAGGSDPIDRQSAELHRRAKVLLRETNLEESEPNYLACLEVVTAVQYGRGVTAAVEPTALDVRCVTGDALDRIARDELGPEYTEQQYVDALREAERTTGLSLDAYDNR